MFIATKYHSTNDKMSSEHVLSLVHTLSYGLGGALRRRGHYSSPERTIWGKSFERRGNVTVDVFFLI